MSSVIDDFTDAADSPATKRNSSAKDAPFLEETSTITTPGNTPRTGTRAQSDAARPKTSAVTLTAKQSAAASGGGKGKGKGKKTKDKPELVTPAEFAKRLRLQNPVTAAAPSEPEPETGHKTRLPLQVRVKAAAQPPSQYLKDYIIFYAGGDLTYASAKTRGCMTYVRLAASLPLFTVVERFGRGG